MKEHERLLDLIRKYLIFMGYKDKAADDFVSDIYEVVSLKLAATNVISQNRNTKSHQSHIAITGKTIDFFYNEKEFSQATCDTVNKIDFKLVANNLDALNGGECRSKDEIEYIETYVTAGKGHKNNCS